MADDDKNGEGEKSGEQKPSKIELTQEKLDELIDKAFARGAKNSKDAKEVQAMKDELEELRGLKSWIEEEAKKQKKGGKEGEGESSADFQEKLDAIRAEYEERNAKLKKDFEEKEGKLTGTVKDMRRSNLRSDVVTGVAGIAAEPREVFTLMEAEGYFKEDEETSEYVVIDPKTKKVKLDVDADGEPLSPAKAAAAWLEDHPRHKRASGRTGSGQGSGDEAGGEGPSSEIDTSKMKPSEIFAKRREIVDSLRR